MTGEAIRGLADLEAKERERCANFASKAVAAGLAERTATAPSISHIHPDDDQLAAQLGSIKWGIDSRGRIKIESKDEMRKRGLPSPGRADAVAQAFSRRVQAGSFEMGSHAGESITGDLMTKAW